MDCFSNVSGVGAWSFVLGLACRVKGIYVYVHLELMPQTLILMELKL